MYVFPIFVYTSANFIALSVRLCECDRNSFWVVGEENPKKHVQIGKRLKLFFGIKLSK